MKYVTKQGDMWDSIAYLQMGSTSKTDVLLNLNPEYRNIFIFPAGIELEIPETGVEQIDTLPPWKKVKG